MGEKVRAGVGENPRSGLVWVRAKSEGWCW